MRSSNDRLISTGRRSSPNPFTLGLDCVAAIGIGFGGALWAFAGNGDPTTGDKVAAWHVPVVVHAPTEGGCQWTATYIHPLSPTELYDDPDPVYDIYGMVVERDGYLHVMAWGMEIWGYSWIKIDRDGESISVSRSAVSSGSAEVITPPPPSGCTPKVQGIWKPTFKVAADLVDDNVTVRCRGKMEGTCTTLPLCKVNVAANREWTTYENNSGQGWTITVFGQQFVLNLDGNANASGYAESSYVGLASDLQTVTHCRADWICISEMHSNGWTATLAFDAYAEAHGYIFMSFAGLDLRGFCIPSEPGVPCAGGSATVLYGWY